MRASRPSMAVAMLRQLSYTPSPFSSSLSESRRALGSGGKAIPMDDGEEDRNESEGTARTVSDEAADFLRSGMPADLRGDAHAAARTALVSEVLSRDKEIFELKRQHELSMLRVEQHQRRMLKDQEDRGMYYEQNVNVHTFDTISVGLFSQRSTVYHAINTEQLRNFKMFLTFMTTIIFCSYLYYRYMINPDWQYISEPIKILGSRVQAVKDERWKRMSEEEKLDELETIESGYKERKR